jgi:peptidoglycan/LPS O-acetylase OafA/YrhL
MIEKLKRITRDGRWIPEIDGLRFVAIGSVFLFHLNQVLENHSGGALVIQHRYTWMVTGINNGFRGVRLFFVISGFILGLPFARQWILHGQPVKIGKYFIRRLTRLEPPYILPYAIVILLWAVFTHGHGITIAYLGHAAAGLFYMHSLAFPRAESVNPVTWSLEIEVQFYILAPLLAYFFRIKGATVRRGLMLLLIALAGFLQGAYVGDEFIKHTILFYIQYFLAGFLLADLYLSHPDRKSNWEWDVFGIFGWAVFFLIPGSRWTNGFYPFLLLPLCGTAFYSRYLRLFFANSIIAVIGGMCYSIYLLHSVLISSLFKITRHLVITGDYLVSLILQIVLAGVPVFLMCAVYFVFVERYFMQPDWPQRWAALWRKERRLEVEVK